jgi:hypothetical protein
VAHAATAKEVGARAARPRTAPSQRQRQQAPPPPERWQATAEVDAGREAALGQLAADVGSSADPGVGWRAWLAQLAADDVGSAAGAASGPPLELARTAGEPEPAPETELAAGGTELVGYAGAPGALSPSPPGAGDWLSMVNDANASVRTPGLGPREGENRRPGRGSGTWDDQRPAAGAVGTRARGAAAAEMRGRGAGARGAWSPPRRRAGSVSSTASEVSATAEVGGEDLSALRALAPAFGASATTPEQGEPGSSSSPPTRYLSAARRARMTPQPGGASAD